VYATAWARRYWEPAARENLGRELAGLASPNSLQDPKTVEETRTPGAAGTRGG
jgi:hypothetical protein